MTHEAPRHSVVFGLRESSLTARHYNSVRVNTAHGAFVAPAYSQDSEVLGCSSTGGVFCRRVPSSPFNNGIYGSHDGKEMASLRLAGGAAWYPTGNKFYHGAAQIDANDSGLFCVIDPETDIPRRVYVAGQDGKTGRRAFWHPANDEIWIAVDSGNTFLRVDPTDDSIVGFVAGSAPIDFTYCASNSAIYFRTAGAVYKCTSGGSVSLLWSQSDLETALGSSVSNFAIGGIEYADTRGAVFFSIIFTWNPGGGVNNFQQLWKIDTGTDVASFETVAGVSPDQWAEYLYYSSQFDRMIAQQQGFSGVLAAYDPADFSIQTATLGTDTMTATKGVYCDNANAIALPVLTGPGGSRFFDVNYYGAADL